MSQEIINFIVLNRPFNENEENISEEIKSVERWKFTCDRPLDSENNESDYMLKWNIKSEDNRYSYNGEIREGYVFQELTENGIPSLEKTSNFVKDKMILEENFSESCIFIPYSGRNITASDILNLANQNPILINLLSSINNTNRINPLSNILNESFIQELERAKNQKKPASKDALEKLEILTVDDNLLKKYMEENLDIKDQAKYELEKEEDVSDMTDEEIYKKVIQKWRNSQSNGIRCAMCMEFVKNGEKVVRLPCTDKDGKKTPHYFHYIEEDEEGNPKTDNCVGCGVLEWLKDHNTCPCCRFELPIEKEEEIEKNENISSTEGEVSSDTTNNLREEDGEINQSNISGNNYQEDLLRSILGLIANGSNNQTVQNPETCQCHICVERRRERERLSNMNEQELVEDQLLREALRRSENIPNSSNNELNRTHEGIDGEMMTEEEAIEAAIRASLIE